MSRLMGAPAWAASLVALLLASASPAGAGEGARQVASDEITTAKPNSPQGDRLSIDFINPGDRLAKPFSVASFVLTFDSGTVIDTSVPEQCKATTAELIAVGPAACPSASRIGRGSLEVDTGLISSLAFPRIVELDLTLFNNAGEVINVTESTNTAVPIRTIVRNSIRGTSVRTEVPPLPGVPPPDPFIALKKVRVSVNAVTRGARTYRRSPPTCPPSGHWTNRIDFTYRDGSEQTVRSPSPCASIRLRGLPRRCARKPFRARIHVHVGKGLRRVEVLLDGKRIRTARKSHFNASIPVRRLAPGRHRLATRVLLANGNRKVRAVRFRRCS